MEQTRELILDIARALVNDSAQVALNVIEGGNTALFELSASKTDIGKVIGKQGKTADAMRVILNALGAKHGKRFNLEVIQ